MKITKTIPEGINQTLVGSLELERLTSIPKGFKLSVGGSLYLGSLTSIPEGFNPTVGGSLYLGSLTSIPEGWLKSEHEYQNVHGVELPLKWKRNGKEYIKCDDRFSEVISKKKNIWKLKDLNKSNEYYLITDGNGNYSHGETIKKAKEDLIFKVSDRDKSEYKNIDINQKFDFKYCIDLYHNITGACSTGIKNFIENSNIIKSRKFTVLEIAKLTKNNYGNDSFCEFFSIK